MCRTTSLSQLRVSIVAIEPLDLIQCTVQMVYAPAITTGIGWVMGCIFGTESGRALEYAIEISQWKQFNKVPIGVPFVLGANTELENCLNLVDANSIKILQAAYLGLKEVSAEAGRKMPQNKENNRTLDCAVIRYIHQSNKNKGIPAYDTIRCAFPEGEEVYPGSAITTRLHIQICVVNLECIKGFFLPRPLEKFNPYLNQT